MTCGIKTVAFAILAIGVASNAASATQYYVRFGGNGTGTGSWGNASGDLHQILQGATFGDVVWVAEGLYIPGTSSSPRTNSFVINSGVLVFGGFEGQGTPGIEDRDPVQFETILSGDFTGDDAPDFENYEDNAYIVVSFSEAHSTTVLDGFTVRGATQHAIQNISSSNDIVSSPSLFNLLIKDNQDVEGTGGDPPAAGAGLFNGGSNGEQCDPVLTNCIFRNNIVEAVTGIGASIASPASSTARSHTVPRVFRTTFTSRWPWSTWVHLSGGNSTSVSTFCMSTALNPYLAMG